MKQYLTIITAIFLITECTERNKKTPLPKVSNGKVDRIESFPSKFIPPRNIDIWLPKRYNKYEEFAVIYMHDKQTLFNSSITWKNLIEPVGKYEPNGYGLYDMGGNAWEWVYDSYDGDYYKISSYDNPTEPNDKIHRVIRGGSWHSGTMCKRVYYRKGIPRGWCDFAVGFRCVREVEQKKK